MSAVIPSWASTASFKELSREHSNRITDAFALRTGYVIKKFYPSLNTVQQEANLSGAVRYTVLADMFDSSRGEAWVKVFNCRVMIPFGSTADQYHSSIRCPVDFEGDSPTKELIESSTHVIVAFKDGSTSQGIIVGCLPNTGSNVEEEVLGHNLFSSFNGIETSINKEGEYTLTSTLETVDAETNKVATPDPDKAGTFIKIDKDGSVFLDTTVDYIAIDKVNHNLELYAQENTYIGSPVSANENLVLGKKLLDAIDKLIQILQTPLTPAIPGQVIASSAAILPLLTAWSSLHTLPNPLTSDLLAQKKFTE